MARKSKDRTHAKKRAHQQQLTAKTEASRKRRLSNKHKREAIRKQMGDVHVVMKDGIPYMNGDKLGLINGIYRLVPTGLPESAIKTECDYEAYYDPDTCEHGNTLASNCSDCDEDILGMSVTAEEPRKVILRNDPAKRRVTCIYPEDEPKSAFSRLKDKLRGNQ